MSDHTRADEGEGREPGQDDLAARFALEERTALIGDLTDLQACLSVDGRAYGAEIIARAVVALTAAEAEIVRLRERVATLEAALRPFAEEGASLDHEDHGHLWESPQAMNLTTEHLRAARAALEAPHADN